MTKSLVNRLYLKQVIYSFKMVEEKTSEEQLDLFNKLILDLENISVKLEDEDQTFLLLISLPKRYSNFKETLLYGRESLTPDTVQAAMSFKELNIKNEEKYSVHPEGLFVRVKFEKREFYKKFKS